MSQTTEQLKSDVTKNLDAMRTLRDEIRVRLHLAKMDAKDEWNKLEPQLLDAEKAAENFTQASYDIVVEAVEKLKNLKTKMS